MNQLAASSRNAGLRVTAFAGAVGLWFLLYIVMMPAIGAPPWTGLLVLIGCPLAAGWAAGRWAAASWRGGLLVGAIIAAINLVILGSLLGDPGSREVAVAALGWVAGCSAVAVVAAAIGAAIGRRVDPPAADWSAVLAVVLVVATFLMIVVGGIVTGLEAGLAVRGWWTSNDYPMVLFPLHLMREDPGVYAEHAHRLWGLLVGLTSIAMVVRAFRDEGRRRWLVPWAVAILLAVIVQGVLGGTRVTERSIVLAIAHGVFGQLVFATMFAVAVALAAGPGSAGLGARLRRLSTLLVVALVVQLAFGATYRHLHAAADVPVGFVHGSLGLHILWVVAIVIVVILAAGRAAGADARWPRLLGRWILGVLLGQVVLGMCAVAVILVRGDDPLIPWYEVLLTTAHQATGAAILALAAGLRVVLDGDE